MIPLQRTHEKKKRGSMEVGFFYEKNLKLFVEKFNSWNEFSFISVSILRDTIHL